MERTVAGETSRVLQQLQGKRCSLGSALPERLSFFMKSIVLLFASGIILYVLLAAHYPAVHDTLHNVRHALAVVPCH